jgi:hypothetical protein
MCPTRKDVGVVAVVAHPPERPLLKGAANVISLWFAGRPGWGSVRSKRLIGIGSSSLAVPKLRQRARRND